MLRIIRKAERRESAETQECVPHISKVEKMDVDELVPGAAQGVETRRFVSNPVVGGSLSRHRPEPAFGHPKHMSMLCNSMELQLSCVAKPDLRSGLSFRRPPPRWRSTRSAAAFGCYRLFTVILHQINFENHSTNNWPNYCFAGFPDRSVLGPSSR